MNVFPVDRLRETPAVEPASAQETARILAESSSAGKRVTPCGGGCFLDLGRSLDRVEMLLRTERMARTVFYEPEELVVKVEAGMILGVLDRLVAERGQELPWDYPWPDRQTVGGIIASGVAGPRRLGFGTPRDHVLGLTAALADGRIIHPGGRVVKNVAGYDVSRLLVGSRGSLAVILEAALKVKPVAEDHWAATARFADIPAMEDVVSGIIAAPVDLSFLEIGGRRGDYAVATGCEGMREQVAAQSGILRRIVRKGASVEERSGAAARDVAREWSRRPWESPGPVFKVSVPRRRIFRILAGVDAPVQVNAGNGIVRVAPGGEPEAGEAKDLLRRLAALARVEKGWAVQERGPLTGRDRFPDRDRRLGELDEAVARAFDPTGCLGPDGGRGAG